MSFAHLHVHSQYSLLKAPSTIPDLVKKSLEYNMKSLALTDYGNLFGALEFYFECKEHGLKPIIGVELYLTEDHLKKDKKMLHHQSSTIVLLAKNQEGYKNLCYLSSIGYQKGFYYIPRIDEHLLKEHSKGLIALTGGEISQVLQIYKIYGPEQAFQKIKNLKNIFQDNFYLEYTKTNPSAYNQFLKESGSALNLPLAASNDVHYVEPQDYIVQDVLICIGNNQILDSRQKEERPDQSFKSYEEMKTLFGEEDSSLFSNTLEISEKCNLEFQLKDSKGRQIYHLPEPRLEKRKNIKSELKYLAEKGLEPFLKNLSEEKSKDYKERLQKEMNIINSMGFTGYFLIVHDFVHWAKNQNIPVGPGRGSGASSLTAYALGITDLDPMPHNLLFERFLNPERISMPDFDIDFCQENRNRVIQYVHSSYGKDFVAQVIAFGRLQAKAAVRDVGRVLSMPYLEVDAIAKLIPNQLGITIESALKQNPELKELTETDSQISTLIDLAQKIEGLVRHVSTHAAGVIIADQPMINYAPLYRGAENENIIQYDLKYAKKIGLVKFDFLGLKTLTHIQRALALIEKNRGKSLTPSDIPLEDEGIYSLMSKGDTLGVFQFEGRGITELIQKAKPHCFADIVAINALFRPGPMNMIPDYLERRKSKTSQYIFPELENVLKETHGVVVYQEQVLLISAIVAGYSFGEADVLRRAMGEKISSEMKKQKTRFLKGAGQKNYNLEKAEKLFDTVAEFAKYGFNKAHAAAYCVLAAQTAWLKHYHPIEFFAALMTTEMGDSSKVTKYIKDAKARGITIKPPHINHSEYDFSVDGNEIYFALGAIKGVGKTVVESIISIRNTVKNFESFEHFLESIDSHKVNKKTIESLTKAGSFDGLGYTRFEILSNIDVLMDRASKKKLDRMTGQTDLFSLFDEKETVHLARGKTWTLLEKLNQEKTVIGFYLSKHPLDYFKPYLSFCPSHTIQGIKTHGIENVKVWGMIEDLRETQTRKGSTMAFGELEDATGRMDLVFFSPIYLDSEKLLKKDEPLYIEGKVQLRENSLKCIVEKVSPLSLFLSRFGKVEIIIPSDAKEDNLKKLNNILEENQGKSSVIFKLNTEKSSMSFVRSSKLLLNVSVLEKIVQLIPRENIKLLH